MEISGFAWNWAVGKSLVALRVRVVPSGGLDDLGIEILGADW